MMTDQFNKQLAQGWREKSLRVVFSQNVIGDPFPHAVVNDLFCDEVLEKICDNYEATKLEFEKDEFGRNVSILSDYDGIGLLIGTGMMDGISSAFYNSQKALRATRFPVFYSHEDHTTELNIHNDFDPEQERIVANLYLCKHKERKGGELTLWRSAKCGFEKVVSYEPIWNRLIVFRISPSSFHSVAPYSGKRLVLSTVYDVLKSSKT